MRTNAEPPLKHQLVDFCQRSGVINPLAYTAIEADQALVGEDISPGDDIYALSTAAIQSGDLAAIETPDGLFVRFVHWFADPTGQLMVRLESANPEVPPMIYEYDADAIHMRGLAVWICTQGDHSRCFACVRSWRGSLDSLPIKQSPNKRRPKSGLAGKLIAGRFK